MKTIPIKPEHQAEIRYLLGEVDHLERMKAPEKEIADAVRRLGERELKLYPEVDGKYTSISADAKSIDVYEDQKDFAAAIMKIAQDEKAAPYTAFINTTGRPVIGPKQ